MPFKKAKDREANPYHIVEIWGREKGGKTRFALTAPTPIYLFNFDRGYDRVQHSMLTTSATIPITPPFTERFEKGLINISDYSGLVSTDASKEGQLKLDDNANATMLVNQFESDWVHMSNQPPGGTAIIDTGTLIWNLVSQVLMKKAPINQPWLQYTLRNDFFRRLLSSARDSGKNVIFIHHDTDIYGSEGTILGQRAQGDKLVARAADVIIRLTAEKGPKPGLPEFKLKIEDCGLNAEVSGVELTNATFDELIDLIM